MVSFYDFYIMTLGFANTLMKMMVGGFKMMISTNILLWVFVLVIASGLSYVLVL